jgi:apolipoprotein D and lipocalin family protein
MAFGLYVSWSAGRPLRGLLTRSMAAGIMAWAAALVPMAVAAPVAPVPALETVPAIDVARYQGTWFQVALYPNPFQKQCVSHTSAHYALLPDGQIRVTNRCRTDSGALTEAVGVARALGKLDGQTLAPPKLQVRFAPAWLSWLPMVWGHYWVIQLAPDYRYVVVGEPSREYLWVLAREPRLNETDWTRIRAKLAEQGYDSQRLVFERH